MHKRKPILLAAYVLAAASRLIFPLVPSARWVIAARFADRISNGLQASPREALISDVAPSERKGACYGLRQTLGLIGSFIGALGLMYFFQSFGHNYTLAFWIAVVPAFLGVGVLLVSVRDHTETTLEGYSHQKEAIPPSPLLASRKLSWKTIKICGQESTKLGRSYWYVVMIASLLTLSNYSGAFMILQAERIGEGSAPLVMLIQNLAAFLAAFPSGWLSDRVGRNGLLAAGIGLVIVADLFLGLGTSSLTIMTGVAFWGLQMGITQSLLVAKVADAAPAELKGTSFGIYYFVSALALFLSNLCAGWLSYYWSAISVFYMSAVFASLALLSLAISRYEPKRKILN